MINHSAIKRARAFCDKFNLRAPILMAPMAGACPPALAIAVAQAGGLGGCGALRMTPDEIMSWASTVRTGTNGGFQLNLWIPDPPAKRDATNEEAIRRFLGSWGPQVVAEAGEVATPNFAAQCEAMLEAGPPVISSIMGLFPDQFVARMKATGIKWFATATTVAEAKAAEEAGADVIVAQGMEAGGHRGTFDAAKAEESLVGLFSLVPAICDAVKLPVVAAGGIADGRGLAAALLLGASAVQVGTAFLRCPEAKIQAAWADALGRTPPEETAITRWFTGRAARSIANAFVRATAVASAPVAAPYPVQRGLTDSMRQAATKIGDIDRMQAWAGQSAALARAVPAGEVVRSLWDEAQVLLR